LVLARHDLEQQPCISLRRLIIPRRAGFGGGRRDLGALLESVSPLVLVFGHGRRGELSANRLRPHPCADLLGPLALRTPRPPERTQREAREREHHEHERSLRLQTHPSEAECRAVQAG
jgi:hypothetical protein